MLCWLTYQPPYLTVSSPSWTLQLGPLPGFVARITLQQRSPAFTGSMYRYPSEFSLSSRHCLPSSTRQPLLDICATNCVASLTCPCEIASSQHHPIVLTFVREVSSTSETGLTGHLPLLTSGSGTVSLMTSRRLHRCRYSLEN